MKHLLLLLAPFALLSACIPDIMNTKPEVRGLEGAAPVQTLTDPAAGEKATLRPDGLLRVKLDSNPTTGYYWQVELSGSDAVELVSEDYVADPAPEGLVGSGGHQVFVFRALEKGNAKVSFSYERSPADIIKAKKLHIKVIE